MAIEIGQKVKVRDQFNGRVPAAVRQKQGQTGTVVDYKIVDGNGVGFVVKFDSQSAWFFEEELESTS